MQHSRIASDSRRRAVVVDKDVHVRGLLSDFLGDIGFQTVFYEDGYSALDAVRLAPPALVITEVLVPRLGGLSAVRLIKGDAALARTKVMVLSVLSAGDRAVESGADAFLQKPLERTSLSSAVTSIVAASQESQL